MVADMSGDWRVDDPHDLQIDARRQHCRQPTATTEQHRNLVDLQLIQYAGLKRSPCRVRAMHQQIALPHGFLRAPARGRRLRWKRSLRAHHRTTTAQHELIMDALLWNVVSNVCHRAGSTHFDRFEIEIGYSLKQSNACANGYGSNM